MSTPLKVKRNTWSIAEENDFLLLYKEKAITNLLDKCVTSAGVSRPFKLSQFISNCYICIINLHFNSKFKCTEDLENTCSYKWSSSRLI